MSCAPPSRLFCRARRAPALRSAPGSALALLAVLGLGLPAGCARFPEVDAFPAAASDGTAPALMPLDSLLAQAPAPAAKAESAGNALAARAARLRTRAMLMRGPVIDPATRARLAAALAAGRI